MSTEIQTMSITKLDWFDEYREVCTKNELLQANWNPAIGDWFERFYRMDLSPIIVKEEREIEILHHKSSALGYWQVSTADGKITIWNSDVELAKGTSKWIPRLDQLIAPFGHFLAGGSLKDIHFAALDAYITRLQSLVPVERH